MFCAKYADSKPVFINPSLRLNKAPFESVYLPYDKLNHYLLGFHTHRIDVGRFSCLMPM